MRGLGTAIIGSYQPPEPIRTDYQRNYKGLTATMVKPITKLRESVAVGKIIPDPYGMSIILRREKQVVQDLTFMGTRPLT